MKRVLIIEDDQAILHFIADTIMQTFPDFEIALATDGESGVRLARETPPDLVICDIQMPMMDGYEVLRVLQSDPRTTRIPFIFLTAYSGANAIRRGFEIGADDYLTKPFDIKTLIKAIEARLEKQDRQRQSVEAEMDQLRNNIIRALPHELRTSLMIIDGYVRFLIDDDDINAEQRQYMQMIARYGRRLQRLSERFLLYTQVELGILEHTFNDSEATTQTIEHAVLTRADQAAQSLRMCVQWATLEIPERYLNVIVAEIVDNAFKFAAPDVPVHVSGEINDTGAYIITVTNAGRGMTAEQIAHIGTFNQFERDVYEQQGVGLGLTLSKRLTDMFDGTLWVESIPDAKTVVTVTLPVCYNEAVDTPVDVAAVTG